MSAPAAGRSVRATLSGWGRYPVAQMQVRRPERIAALCDAVRAAPTVLGRGLGRSYGDAALNSGGAVVLSQRLDRMLAFDAATATLQCEAGVSLADLMRVFVPRGFFPPVVPGTQQVTLGGAVASDVHGKNHHHAGTFGRHVLALHIVGADGRLRRCSRTEEPALFHATLGGMGLTGLIADVTLRLQPISSAWLRMDVDRAPDLDRALDLFEGDVAYAHSVAWIDCLARGAALGRSVLMRADPLAAGDLEGAAARAPLAPAARRRWRLPFDLPGALLNRVTVGAFNAAYYRAHAGPARGVPVHHEAFFFPLDRIGDWNRLYGRAGFQQFQCAVPLVGGREALMRLLTALSGSGRASFLAVLKRFGPDAGEGLLSFPLPGYTLALDLPQGAGLSALLERLHRLVAEAGGRIYLAKDASLPAELLPAMYPGLARWREVKEAIDPEHRFASDLSRRLGLTR